jgi:hypothetical protein
MPRRTGERHKRQGRREKAPRDARCSHVSYEQHNVSVDQGADFIRRQYGLPLTRESLLEICDSGWQACRFDDQGRWTIDPEGLIGEDAPRELARRIVSLAADRTDVHDMMEEPPGGREAGGGI